MNIAIIPARGGSKRIPGKNIKIFAGKPIIAYSILAALESELFDRVIVSTDSLEIAKVAKEFGAEVPFLRDAALAGDFTGTDEVLVDALEIVQNQMNCPVKYLCCLYATAPFVRGKDLRRGYQDLVESGAGTAFTVTNYSAPIFRSLKLNDQGRLVMIWPEFRNERSQDLPEAFHDAGQFYWADAQYYLKEKKLWSDDALPIYVDRQRVEDIDTPEDWIIAEKKFTLLEK